MLEAGMIILWYGSIASIPDGWLLCNGANGTPDLRDKFIVGAGDTYSVDDTGGNATHTHSFISDPHFHTLIEGAEFEPGTYHDKVTDSKVVTGDTDATPSLPPYHSLAFIMKT